MKKAEFEFVVRSVTEQMVGFLMEDYGMSILDAFDKYTTLRFLLSCKTRLRGCTSVVPLIPTNI